MAKTLEQLLRDMSLNLNGDTDVPSGDEYDLWVRALNLSQDDWAETDYNWPSLKIVSYATLQQSGTSIALPVGFEKLDGFPLIDGVEYQEIRSEEVNLHENDDYVITNLRTNSLNIHPAAATTVQVSIPYFSGAVSFTTLTDVSLCPSDNYLINKATSKIFLQRDNQKYVEFQNSADSDMLKMISKDASTLDQKDTSIKNKVVRGGFILGRD